MNEESSKAAILGLFQGLTEFFPVSSSAHLRVLRELLAFEIEGLAFDIAVHVATLLAVLVYFRQDIVAVLTGAGKIRRLALIAVASVPLFAVGYAFASQREGLSLWVPVVCWTISGTYLLFLKGRSGQHTWQALSVPKALAIGVAQSLAFFPGMSRSGSTIAAGIFLGLEKDSAARFSFLLSIPTILGAGAYQCLKILQGASTEGMGVALAIGMPVAFVTGMLAIHLLLKLVRGNKFYLFGWYNLTAALAFAAYLAAR